ncbi:multiple inositol polyphosphate phosphatase 1-like [Planococcus citri]|uniref:multiple inositol polyphosphate phosphatase 1-like n=1 Tax=Planococcus citri TaxID=170843 RepID=UPI0031F8EB17
MCQIYVNKMGKFFLIFIFSSFARLSYQEEYCYVDDQNPYVYFSSATAYSNVRSMNFEAAKNCEPIYTWGLIKHGTTYMSKDQIESTEKLFSIRDEILKNHREKRGKLCQKDLNNLESWNLKLDKNKADQLVTPGMIDQMQFARRLKSVFSSLFKSTAEEYYEFQTSSSKITKEGSIAFVGEILQKNVKGKDAKELGIIENSWINEDENQNADVEEMKKILNSEETSRVMKEISTRLGFEKVLPFGLLTSMYEVCAFENAWGTDPTPAFCAAFLRDELQMIEYVWDLGNYYSYGYGNTKNDNFGKPLFEDMLNKIIDASDGKLTKKGSFLFSEQSPISAIIKKLGLYHDEQPLKHDNYQIMTNSRKWRSSIIDCFSSNILAVVYSCSGDNHKRVEFYHNENSIKIPQCEKDYCSIKELKQLKSKINVEAAEKKNPEEKTDDNSPPKSDGKNKDDTPKDKYPEENKNSDKSQPTNPDDGNKNRDKSQPGNTAAEEKNQNSGATVILINLGVLCLSCCFCLLAFYTNYN